MNRPSFLEGVVVALVASLAGTAVDASLSLFLYPGSAPRLVIAGLGLAYVLYLLGRSQERMGRLTSLLVWLLVAGLTGLLAPPLALYLLIHLGLLWLARALYHHASPLAALLDLGLVFLGLAMGLWAIGQSNSLFLGLWCFFLVQALFGALPVRWGGGSPPSEDAGERFERAHRTAEAALRRLSTHP